jgi:hypothetical protein
VPPPAGSDTQCRRFAVYKERCRRGSAEEAVQKRQRERWPRCSRCPCGRTSAETRMRSCGTPPAETRMRQPRLGWPRLGCDHANLGRSGLRLPACRFGTRIDPKLRVAWHPTSAPARARALEVRTGPDCGPGTSLDFGRGANLALFAAVEDSLAGDWADGCVGGLVAQWRVTAFATKSDSRASTVCKCRCYLRCAGTSSGRRAGSACFGCRGHGAAVVLLSPCRCSN